MLVIRMIRNEEKRKRENGPDGIVNEICMGSNWNEIEWQTI